MKTPKALALLFLSAFLVSFTELQAQSKFHRDENQTLEDFLTSTLPMQDGYESRPSGPIGIMRWGNPNAGEKIVYLFAAPGKSVGEGDSQYYLDGPLLLMVMEHLSDDQYLLYPTDTAAQEVLVGTYPRTTIIDSVTTADLDGDGSLECIIRFYGSQRCEVELEEENPETGEITTFTTMATCDCVAFGILRQEKEKGNWRPSFTVEFIYEDDGTRDYGGYQTFPDFIRNYLR
jgi:hypothetical protein